MLSSTALRPVLRITKVGSGQVRAGILSLADRQIPEFQSSSVTLGKFSTLTLCFLVCKTGAVLLTWEDKIVHPRY